MKKGIWVLTREINLYDQEGQYFESAWINKPTEKMLSSYVKDKEVIKHLLNTGGGRKEEEHEWYYLKEI